MQVFVEELTTNYLENIRKSREKSQFLYTLYKTDYETRTYDCWLEHPFVSNRTFANLFFDGKAKLLKQLDFFVENKAWYDRLGIPYTMGIGLSGPPGTGKTSLIKCIANHLKRHVVSMSLKLIKTRMQLLEFFYETQYNSQNRPQSVGFDKKVVVLEDIDCLGNLVKNRTVCTTFEKDAVSSDPSEKNKLIELLRGKVPKHQLDSLLTRWQEADTITLDDMLNLWDGICETPHRILIITSNHYDELDPALVRPGRIDLTLNMGSVTPGVVQEMYTYLFEKPWPTHLHVSATVANKYTPAQIINLFLQSGNDEQQFLKPLTTKKSAHR